jgi:hypothetical protein
MEDGRFKYLIYLKKKIDLFNLDDNEEEGKEKNKCVLLWQVRKKKDKKFNFFLFCRVQLKIVLLVK